MKMIIKENIKLLNRYMNDRTYLRLDQNRNDRIRNSLSWKITQPIRAIGKYKYFLNKKLNYCHDYKKWISEFPQFNENDKDIFENFQNNYKESIVVILIVDHIYIDSILETLKTISQQNIFVDTVFIISKN
ncbi:hypothetical protein, partial [Komagataeibacter sp. FXV3]|uniref:hypothetical protein n=1 Tax=Komagataeibacter sp. FXV3 TaxID=2608998 RepID=UPI001D0F8DA7